jgi:hypothetical protein
MILVAMGFVVLIIAGVGEDVVSEYLKNLYNF